MNKITKLIQIRVNYWLLFSAKEIYIRSTDIKKTKDFVCLEIGACIACLNVCESLKYLKIVMRDVNTEKSNARGERYLDFDTWKRLYTSSGQRTRPSTKKGKGFH